MTFEFDTRDFQLTYGRAPKGYGSWAFQFGTSKEPVFAPTSTYAEAKTWMKNHVRALAPKGYAGFVYITVCT